MNTTVWAYKRIKALGDQLGFVECSQSLANQLIADGDAQDPRVGGTALKHIQYDSVSEEGSQPVNVCVPDEEGKYATKVVEPATKKAKK